MILGTGLGGVGTLIDGFTTNALRGPDRISPFLIPMGIPNIGAGQVAIQFGMTGPELRDGVGLRDRRPRPRRGERDRSAATTPTSCSPAAPRPASTRRLVGGFAAMRALSTRNDDPAGGVAPVRHRARRLRHRRGRGRRRPRGARARRGARRRDPGRARRLRRDGRRVAHHAAGAGRHRRRPGRPARAREGRPARPTTSTTSTPMRPRRPKATRPSCRRSGRSSATGAGRVSITANKSMLGHTLGAAGAIEAIVVDPDHPRSAACRRRST